MIKIKELQRANRKTLSIVITPSGEVVVKAPLNLPESKIYAFIEEKTPWILARQAKIQSSLDRYNDVIAYNKLMLFGKIYPVYKSASIKQITVDSDRVLVPNRIEISKLFKKFINFYKTVANKYLIARLNEISNLINLKPTSTQITGSRGRWGACTNKGKIMLSWRAVLIDKNLIDYIIVHELVHLIELNHSTKFWSNVEKLFPNYKQARNELKQLGFILKLF